MEYSKINTNHLRQSTMGSCWCLDRSWWKKVSIIRVPSRYITSELSEVVIDDLWKYIESIEGVAEPEWLSLLDLCENMAPIRKMIPHLTALTALKLNWLPIEGKNDPFGNTLTDWLGSLTSTQKACLILAFSRCIWSLILIFINNCCLSTCQRLSLPQAQRPLSQWNHNNHPHC